MGRVGWIKLKMLRKMESKGPQSVREKIRRQNACVRSKFGVFGDCIPLPSIFFISFFMFGKILLRVFYS